MTSGSSTRRRTLNNKLWAADPHQYGPGKVHIVDDSNEDKTLCGRFLSAVPGSVSSGKPTCRICLDATVRRPEQERQRAEYERQRQERERQVAAENEQWQAWYQGVYLKSPAWKARREKVMRRADGICEGCLVETATEVHHLTYKHVGDEFLWELRAICRSCHERLHEIEQEARR